MDDEELGEDEAEKEEGEEKEGEDDEEKEEEDKVRGRPSAPPGCGWVSAGVVLCSFSPRSRLPVP